MVEPTLASVSSKLPHQCMAQSHTYSFKSAFITVPAAPFSFCFFRLFLDCGISFQTRFSSDPHLVALCLKSITDYYLTVDPTTRLNTFYVLNDLLQVSFNIHTRRDESKDFNTQYEL